MIKDFETYISEGRMGRLVNVDSFYDRREDDNTNILSIKEVDLGDKDILFADRLFEIDGNIKNLSLDNINELPPLPNGWRLPTYDEIKKLCNVKNIECKTLKIEKDNSPIHRIYYQIKFNGSNGKSVSLDFSTIIGYYADSAIAYNPFLTSTIVNTYNVHVIDIITNLNIDAVDDIKIKKSIYAHDCRALYVLLVKDK